MYDGLCAMFAWWMYYVCPVVCPVVGITDLLPRVQSRLLKAHPTPLRKAPEKALSHTTPGLP